MLTTITSNLMLKKNRTALQGRYGLILLLFCTNAFSSEYIYTIINGEPVAEFGDRGKAPNQYPTKAGNLNIIQPDTLARIKTYGDNEFKVFSIPDNKGSTESYK